MQDLSEACVPVRHIHPSKLWEMESVDARSAMQIGNISAVALNLHKNLETILSLKIGGFAKVSGPRLSSVPIH